MILALSVVAFLVVAVASFIAWMNLKHRAYFLSLSPEEQAREMRFIKSL